MSKRIRKPKYSIGTKLIHTSTGKWCIIEKVFESYYADGGHYEFIYYVRHSGWAWSVPERFLSRHRS